MSQSFQRKISDKINHGKLSRKLMRLLCSLEEIKRILGIR